MKVALRRLRGALGNALVGGLGGLSPDAPYLLESRSSSHIRWSCRGDWWSSFSKGQSGSV
jgi:hypothetical protein